MSLDREIWFAKRAIFDPCLVNISVKRPDIALKISRHLNVSRLGSIFEAEESLNFVDLHFIYSIVSLFSLDIHILWRLVHEYCPSIVWLRF